MTKMPFIKIATSLIAATVVAGAASRNLGGACGPR
jgi:hypothetical protein